MKPIEGWRKPTLGILLINVHATYDRNSGYGRTGVVIRDCHGNYIASSHRYLMHVVHAAMAEAYAFRGIAASAAYWYKCFCGPNGRHASG